MKILVAQYYTANLSYGQYSEKINDAYCVKNDYLYYLETDEVKIKKECSDRSMHWYKPLLILEAFIKYPNYDYILFLDIDAVFINHDRKIEEFIDGNFSILMTKDYGPSLTNTGVMLIKNDDFSKQFLRFWWEAGEEFPQYKRGLWWDQSVIEPIYNRLGDKDKIKIIDPDDINSRYFDRSKFIFHAFSYGSVPNRTIDGVYYKILNIKRPSGKTLLDIAPLYDTDKQYEHDYFKLIYDKVLSPLKYSLNFLIVIGIKNEDSVLLWKDFFENSTIIGVEKHLDQSINISNAKDLIRVDLLHKDASKQEDVDYIIEKYPSVDVIIDDGSHKMFDQQYTFSKLFKTIKPGGIYIIEDLHTSIEAINPDKKWCAWGDPEKTLTLDMLRTYKETGRIVSDYISKEDADYLENNINTLEIYQSRPDWSITSIITKKENPVVVESSETISIEKENPVVVESSEILFSKKRNIIVYHIYCVNDYIDIVRNQLNRLKDSGLYDWCDILEVTCIDLEGNFSSIDELFLEFPKANIFKTRENKYEYWAIKKVWELSQLYEGKVFYFHTKGVSNKYKNIQTKELSEWKIKGVKFWKECMEYYLIDNYNTCVNLLDDYDHCGVTCNNGWYSGNFWWVNLSYIKQNPEPGHGDRWYYENWLNSGRDYKSYEFFHFDYNGFFSYFPEFVYKQGKRFSDFDCILDSASYGAIGIQQDEGYVLSEYEMLVDVTDKVSDLIKKGDTISYVDNKYFGDPAYMVRKYLIINFTINGEKGVLVYNEGSKFDISFILPKKMAPKILFLGHTSKVYDGHSIKIDRSDLTRRMSCLETWVPEVEYRGHEVVFFEGDSEKPIYDEVNRLLSLPISGAYDYVPCRIDPPRSLMFGRLLAAIEWALENKEFDYIFRTDDGSYINYFLFEKIYEEIDGYDFIGNNFLGGAGMFFSKDLCSKLINNNKIHDYATLNPIEDIAICMAVQSLNVKIKHTNLLCHQYILGEKFFTVHYTNGKRMYFSDYIIKHYYNNKHNYRKIILNYIVDSYGNNYPNTWNFDNGITPRWYSHTTNHENWEHYGHLTRSNYNVATQNPFGKNSINKLVIYKTLFDIEIESEKNTLLSYIDSLNSNGTMFLFYEEENDSINNIIQFLFSKNLKVCKGLTDINYIIPSNDINNEQGIVIQIKK